MTELKQSLGFFTVLSLSVSSVAGTTLFFGTSIGAQYAGNLSLLAWVALSVIAIYIAAIFGELVALYPKSGGAYEFGKQAYGRFWSFILGWTAWLVGNISGVVMIVGAVRAFSLNIPEPMQLLVSIIIILLLNVVAYIGLEAGAAILIGLAAITIGVAAFIITGGALNFNPDLLLEPIIHSPLSIFVVIFFLTESYFGWEGATYLSEETKNPRRVIPKALIISTAIVALLGALIMLVILGTLGWEEAASLENPAGTLMTKLFGETGRLITAIGIFLTFIGAAAGSIITMPRLLLSLARDRLFLGQLKAIHPKFNTPHKAVIFQTAILILFLFMGLGNYEILLNLLVPLALIMYIFLILSVTVLRHKKPELPREFKIPFGTVGPILISLLFISMMVIWLITVENSANFFNLSLSLIFVGLPLYLLVEVYYDPKAITGIDDILAHFTWIQEKLSYPQRVKTDIFSFLGNVESKIILEYGCGVGSLTVDLLEAVGPNGKVIATHYSKTNLKITNKKIDEKKWESERYIYGKSELIHDPDHFTRVHPNIDYVDGIVSVGMLGYMHDIDKILKEMYDILPNGGRLIFVEFGDFFHVIPNVEWLGSNKKIEQIFRKAGFSVRVVRQKNLLWDRIFLYGVKLDTDVAII